MAQKEVAMIEVDLSFLPLSEGGRRSLPPLDGFKYRPNIVVSTLEDFRKSPHQDQVGVVFADAPKDVQFGKNFRCRLFIWAWTRERAKEIDFVTAERPFVMVEGLKAVGHGQILRRWEEQREIEAPN
jgi:hypothetical protein